MRRSEERIVLICEECGERLVLIGPKDLWRSERTVLKCGCGQEHTLVDRLDEETLGVKEILRGSRAFGA